MWLTGTVGSINFEVDWAVCDAASATRLSVGVDTEMSSSGASDVNGQVRSVGHDTVALPRFLKIGLMPTLLA